LSVRDRWNIDEITFGLMHSLLVADLSAAAAAEDTDPEVIQRIKDGAFNHSKVMDYSTRWPMKTAPG
jgi:hypothetical protein